jgi:acyl dehydratase
MDQVTSGGYKANEGPPGGIAIPAGHRVLVHVSEPVDRSTLKRYAAASLDFNPMHVDDGFARRAGEPAVIAHGMLTLSIVVERALEAFPTRGRPRGVDVRFGRKLDVDERIHVWLQIDSWSEEPGARIAHTEISGEDAEGNAFVNGQMDVAFSA